MKILTIIGARPQFIKASVVSRAIAEASGLNEVIVHTGQHFDPNMSDIFFNELDIPKPDHLLAINGGTHGDMTGRMLIEIERVMLEEKPDLVLVYGDTNSTLAGALAAAKLHIPVAHIEAGLRSFNREMPEEINRLLTDHVSDILFCPTAGAVQNLAKEGIGRPGVDVLNVGDVMLDSALFFSQAAMPPPFFATGGDGEHLLSNDQKLRKAGGGTKDFILSTLHRAENTDDPVRLRSLVEGLNEVHKSVAPVVMPVHPRTTSALKNAGLDLKVYVIEPVGYMEMLWMLRHCGLVITDSGGLQKEAFFFERFCITMRDQTEWTELVDVGANVLVGAERAKLVRYSGIHFGKEAVTDSQPYGNGNAAQNIVAVLEQTSVASS